MDKSNVNYLNKRVLRLNVGFLLSDGPGNAKDTPINITDPVKVADDLYVNAILGELRLSRNHEGVLAQGTLVVRLDRSCSRCLDLFDDEVIVRVEELYAYPRPLDDTEFFIGQDAQLDLAPLLRAEVFIELSHKKLCRDDCKGLCPVCGANHNHESCECDKDFIDPRLAELKKLLDSTE